VNELAPQNFEYIHSHSPVDSYSNSSDSDDSGSVDPDLAKKIIMDLDLPIGIRHENEEDLASNLDGFACYDDGKSIGHI